jgi:hypothetical protein
MLKAQTAWLAGQAQAAALLGRDEVNALMSITDGILLQRTCWQGKEAVMDRSIARANIDHYLGLLDDESLTSEGRASVTKLLIEEEDKFSHDLEQLQFAESRAANGRVRLDGLRQKLEGITEFAVQQPTAERLLANFEAMQKLLDDFCDHLRAKVNASR